MAVSADTAVQVWGGQWHMPTSAQCQELIDNTTYEWVTDYQGSGINGGTFTANGKTLFIPAAGSINGGDYFSGKVCCLSSTPDGNDSYFLAASSNGAHVYDMNSRSEGESIRPVVG